MSDLTDRERELMDALESLLFAVHDECGDPEDAEDDEDENSLLSAYLAAEKVVDKFNS